MATCEESLNCWAAKTDQSFAYNSLRCRKSAGTLQESSPGQAVSWRWTVTGNRAGIAPIDNSATHRRRNRMATVTECWGSVHIRPSERGERGEGRGARGGGELARCRQSCACACIKGTHPEGRPLAAEHRKCCCAGLFTPQAPAREAEAAHFPFL